MRPYTSIGWMMASMKPSIRDKEKGTDREESKFTIVCRGCGFTGGVYEFDISVEVCDCGSCSGGAEITITCRSCHSDMEFESW